MVIVAHDCIAQRQLRFEFIHNEMRQ